MSRPPPLGQPWLANVGNNPNINRDPPPPPVGGPPGGITVNGPPPAQGPVFVGGPAPAHGPIIVDGPPPPIGVGLPPLGFGVDVGIAPYGIGMGLGMGAGGAFGSFGPRFGSGLAPPAFNGFWKLPQYGGIGYGNGGFYGGPGLGGLGLPGLGFPPPPIPLGGLGAGVGVPAPFLPGNPLWAGPQPFPGVGWPQPAPAIHDGTHGPVPPDQQEITTVPGGVPPHATRVAADEYTMIIHLKTQLLPWQHPNQAMTCESLQLDSSTSINRLIQVLNENNDCDGFAVTECCEIGNGMWEKGQTFVYNSAPAIVSTLKGVGWTKNRNRDGHASLHVVLHHT